MKCSVAFRNRDWTILMDQDEDLYDKPLFFPHLFDKKKLLMSDNRERKLRTLLFLAHFGQNSN